MRLRDLNDGPPPTEALENIELSLLLEGICNFYGFDFRNYAPASLKRRVMARVQAEGLQSVSELLSRVLYDPATMERLLLSLTIHVTSLFRDPTFYHAFRRQVVPLLRTYPFIRLWVAGCATGEEVYSLAILLHEEGLIERTRLYGTDLSAAVIEKAKAGIFPLSAMREYTENYLQAGGRGEFSEYYASDAGHAVIARALRKNIVFARHDLVTDGSLNEFNVVFCRNVMIYFNKVLQQRVHQLIYESLVPLGVLCVGRGENLRLTSHEAHYAVINEQERIYRLRPADSAIRN
ncbi:MAG: protein-glutamate O-methyltransferase CheR [Verrucomicrobiota bacterium]|nr:protein-glutamate O-methyltransferase CheR [Verrucomicrobiota bacterium]